MSFKCGICGIQVPPREKATRIVTDVREAVYPFRKDANTFIRCEKEGDKWIPGKKETSNDPGGTGIEIAKEVLACKACATTANTFAEVL